MPEEIETLEQGDIERSLTKEQRDDIDASDFAWPEEKKYPIDTQEHLDAAAKLIGRAPEDKQSAIKERAIKIAKRKGFTLPESWQENDSKERASVAEHHTLFMPITQMARADAPDWVVEGQATAEVPDSYGTIFTYEASKNAFQRWIDKYANVREMHNKKAVAKGFGVQFDDEHRRILVRTRVSKAAQDTWTKLQEGVLNGFSIGATNVRMGKMTYEGKSYPAITSYDLAELSYVDNPSCPGCDISLMRADGLITDVVDTSEPEPEEKEEEQIPESQTPLDVAFSPSALERAGARLSSDTQSSLHAARDGAIQSAMQLMALCDCPDCQKMAAAIDPDHDGDIDLPGTDDDPDGDAEQLQAERMERLMAPVYQRQQLFLARLSSLPTSEIDLSPVMERLTPIMERLTKLDAIEAALERVALPSSSLDEVRASLEAVKGQVERIAASPAPGGPILNGARPVDKTLMSSSSANYSQQEHTLAVLERLQQTGALDTIDKQVAAAALAVVPTRGRIG